MKKCLISLLAILLAGVLVFSFAGCGKTEPTDEPSSTEEISEPETSDIPVDASEAATDEPTSEEATEEPTTEPEEEGLKDPTNLAKAELVEWYNERINYVRQAKPGIGRVEQLKIDSFKTSMGAAVNRLAGPIIKRFMPGNPETKNISKGAGNDGQFFTDMQTSQLRASDVASATATKSGNNYVITLTFGNETNPEKNSNYKYYRAFAISTRQEVLDDLAGTIAAKIENTTMVYHGGKSVITVNPDGQIIAANYEFKVDVNAKGAKIGPFTTEIDAYQSSSNVYTNFVY